jgi:hypothetical protein
MKRTILAIAFLATMVACNNTTETTSDVTLNETVVVADSVNTPVDSLVTDSTVVETPVE